jgi:hypothetical protein
MSGATVLSSKLAGGRAQIPWHSVSPAGRAAPDTVKSSRTDFEWQREALRLRTVDADLHRYAGPTFAIEMTENAVMHMIVPIVKD